MTEKLTRFDVADYLNDEDDIAALLEAANEDGDPAVMAMALGAIARARNLSALSRDTGMTRAGLRRALSGTGNPSLDTIVKVGKALGIRVELKPATAPRKRA